MPQYDYGCPSCGSFTLSRPMAEYDRPQPCPGCGETAPRVLLTVPAIGGMDGASRVAAATNERSANEPRRSHPGGCGCCRPSKLKAEAVAASAPSSRPWMIGH